MKRTLSILLVVLLVLFALPTAADEEGLQAGLYVSNAGAEIMYLYEDGTGVLAYNWDGQRYFCGVVWTADSLEIERTGVPFAVTDDVFSFTFSSAALAFRYQGTLEIFDKGDQNGTSFAGTYSAEDGKKLSLTADGRGVYTDETGDKEIFWGSLQPFSLDENMAEGVDYILFDSYLSGLDFAAGEAILTTETGETITLHPMPEAEAEAEPAPEPEAEPEPAPEPEAEPEPEPAPEPEAEPEPEPAPEPEPEAEPEPEPEPEPKAEPTGMTIISPAFDLCVNLPVDKWIVEETEGGLVVSRQKDFIQYVFLSVALEKEPSAAMLDTYADHFWNDSLMGVSVAYDAGETVRNDFALAEATGRTAATDWTRDGVEFKGDSVLWYTNGRLYVALCVSGEDSRAEALTILGEALASFRTAEKADLEWENQLPVDKAAFENTDEMPTEPALTDQVYYGYRVTVDGETIDILEYMVKLGMDPKSISLTLRADGTGLLQIADEEPINFTWTDEAFVINEETLPYTREGEHILFAMEKESIEFAPEAEVDAMIAGAEPSPEQNNEPVVLTADILKGSWTLTKNRIMGKEVPADQKSVVLSLVFNEDGTAIELVDGTPCELEWAIREDGKVVLTEAGVEKYVLVYDGTVLTVDAGTDSLEMIFEKDA